MVGIDGTDEALSAARWAAAVAAGWGESLHLVHVMRGVDEALLVFTAPPRDDAGAYPRELGEAVLQRVHDAVRADFPDLRILRTLSRRTPVKALTELSRDARMVVLACAEVSPVGALFVGSTTLAVVAGSACPVVAWRGEVPAPTEQPIVVGIDECRISRAALSTAFGLADGLGVGLVVVNAMSPRRAPGQVNIPVMVDWQALEERARLRLSDIVAPVSARWPAVDVRYAVGRNAASRVIIDHAVGAQLVVVGSRGRGEVASALLGSTGLALLHHSPVPIVLCPASHAENESRRAVKRSVAPAHVR